MEKWKDVKALEYDNLSINDALDRYPRLFKTFQEALKRGADSAEMVSIAIAGWKEIKPTDSENQH